MDKRDLISTKWACRMGLKPLVNAVSMEAMVALGQLPEPFSVNGLFETHCAIWDVGDGFFVYMTIFVSKYRERMIISHHVSKNFYTKPDGEDYEYGDYCDDGRDDGDDGVRAESSGFGCDAYKYQVLQPIILIFHFGFPHQIIESLISPTLQVVVGVNDKPPIEIVSFRSLGVTT
ncbi:hypothetical protein TorRG33x02_167240 [Trema orientale]|uniref:Uncharacterized protein n=1 Tax=Trema orientale TaxID=63057 RepID=A0A2P5EPU8_TREOI|nr:hypothetical protein TorRG33x02_167240 [Trema orientale]